MLEIGAILEGKVTGLTGFGAFVSLPDGSSGMVHISEVSNTYVKDIKDFLKEDQQVKVKVVGISPEGKISLSIRKAMEQENESRKPRFEKGERGRSFDRQRQSANVWQGQPKQNKGNLTFEEMMTQFKQVSDEKMTDLKRNSDSKHSGGYSRRNKNNG